MKGIALFDKTFKPAGEYHLVRLGSNHDGGYLVAENDIDNTDILVSLGICDDWAFEADFRHRKKVNVEAFDGTTGYFPLLKMLVKSILNVTNPLRVFHSIYALINYPFFFSGNKRHHKILVGYDNPPNFISLDTIFKKYVHPEQKVYLKIDIEGWEYRVLDELQSVSGRISGMVIEYHSLDLHIDKVKEFISHFPLKIAHIHCNNFAPLTPDGIPLSIEMTFTDSVPI